MLDIKITRTTSPKEKPQDETKLGFGKKFTDHMFVMDYTEGEGWHDARIVPYAPFPLDPATVVAADRGVPVVYLESDGPAKSAFLALADAIAEAADNSLEALSSPNS